MATPLDRLERDLETVERQMEGMANMGAASDRRIDEAHHRLDKLELSLPEMIRSTIADAVTSVSLSEQERAYVRLAIEREARREGLHRAIVEKSLAGLVWAGIAAVGTGAWQLLKQYLKQP